ncbi:MAG: tetratricopeptide repeat protein [Bacteroidetes bacterium]|nr:tetratricopeptide repeat protein [Bacteroidota bacterium]
MNAHFPKIAIVGLIITLLIGCSNPQKELNQKIATLEKQLMSDSSMTPIPEKAKEMIALYNDYVTKFPDDSLCANYLFKAGDLASKINNPELAVETFGRLISKYPKSPDAPVALFLQGFIYENQAGNPAKAKPYYEAFLKQYPDHPLSGDVSFSLEHLGKTPEELIREFEQNTTAADSAIISAAR